MSGQIKTHFPASTENRRPGNTVLLLTDMLKDRESARGTALTGLSLAFLCFRLRLALPACLEHRCHHCLFRVHLVSTEGGSHFRMLEQQEPASLLRPWRWGTSSGRPHLCTSSYMRENNKVSILGSFHCGQPNLNLNSNRGKILDKSSGF